MKKTLESKIEDYFKYQIKLYGALPTKYQSPGLNGVPDQLVFYDGRCYLVELKRPGEKPRIDQYETQKLFERQGFKVYNLDTKESIDWFIHDVLKLNKPIQQENNKPTIKKLTLKKGDI